MRQRTPARRRTRALVSGVMLAAMAMQPATALVPLADAPLPTAGTPEYNLFLLIDNSVSMDWEVLTTDQANGGRFTATQPGGLTEPNAGIGTVTHRNPGTCDFGVGGQDFIGYIYGTENGTNTYSDDGNDCNTAADDSPRFRNADFNKMYFDPKHAYTPSRIPITTTYTTRWNRRWGWISITRTAMATASPMVKNWR